MEEIKERWEALALRLRDSKIDEGAKIGLALTWLDSARIGIMMAERAMSNLEAKLDESGY